VIASRHETIAVDADRLPDPARCPGCDRCPVSGEAPPTRTSPGDDADLAIGGA